MNCSEETALSVAKRVFDTYSSGDQLANDGMTRMLVDAYEQMNQEVTIDDQDISDYQTVLDVDNDKRVTLEDFQKLALKYLVGTGDAQDVEIDEIPIVEVPKKVTTATAVKTTTATTKTTTITTTNTDQQKISELTGAQLTATKPAEVLKVQAPLPIAKPPITKQPQQPQYNKRTQSKLEVAKRLFNQFQRNGFITDREVPSLLKETYKQFGMAYETSQEDVKSWMLMADQDGDGKVYYEDFSAVILDGLTQAGINIY